MSLTLDSQRHLTLSALRDTLQSQQGRKLDLIVRGDQLNSVNANLRLRGQDRLLTEDGFIDPNGIYWPTDVFDEGVADKLKIPLAYLRRLRAERVDIYDDNVNGWLSGEERNFMVRLFRGDAEQVGVARALLSDKYGIMDNLDVLLASLDGIKQAGVDVQIDGCDLTDRRMYVRVSAPQVSALAPELLKNYRSPFTGEQGADNPVVFAGFVITNSEIGNGAFNIIPRVTVQVCQNGATFTKDAMRAVHLGKRQDEGHIQWSHDTVQKELAVVTARARDSVATFLSGKYLQEKVEQLESASGVKIKQPEQVKVVAKKLGFDQEAQDAIFSMFIEGADLTAGGVMQAVTAAAQTVSNADKAYEMEAQGVPALELAASL